jgi:hypothetical protein
MGSRSFLIRHASYGNWLTRTWLHAWHQVRLGTEWSGSLCRGSVTHENTRITREGAGG